MVNTLYRFNNFYKLYLLYISDYLIALSSIIIYLLYFFEFDIKIKLISIYIITFKFTYDISFNKY